MAKGKKAPADGGGMSKRSDGRWDVYITVPTLEGPKKLRSTIKKEADARRWLNRKRYERDEGILAPQEADTLTVGEYLTSWLKTIRGTVSRHTYTDYEGKVRLHLIPAIGKVKLKALTAAQLQELYHQKLAAGAGVRTVQYVHATIRKALEQAEAWDLVRKNVARHVKPPRKGDSEHRVFSVEEVKEFFEATAGDRFEALYVLALTTGLRQGELLALKWSDVDLERGYLRVQRSLDYRYGPAQEKEPKRKASKRRLKLLPEAVVALEAHKERQAQDRQHAGPRWVENDYVFPTNRGTAMNPDNLRNRSLKPALERAGLPRLTFHELRHTFATLNLEAGEPAKVVSEILRHASIVQTLDTYSHVSAPMLEQTAGRLRDHLFGE